MPERGVLVVQQRKKDRPLILVRVGDKPPLNIAAGEVSQSILDNLAAFAEKEVEFERVKGQPKQVREVGGSFVPPRSGVAAGSRPAPPKGGSQQQQRPQGRGEERREQREQSAPGVRRDFHNPYNFVPAPPRNIPRGGLGNDSPVKQDAYLPDRYTGSIRVRMTAITPVLVPDTEQVAESANGHKTYPLRVGEDGKPLIPASSVRGMLRSAYEMVTNSRFGRFSQEHRKRLKYRESRRPFAKLDYPASAWELLPNSLRPAASVDKLSPADRVFGWVKVDAERNDGKEDKQVAVRGLLRVGPVRCKSTVAEAVQEFAQPGVPLAILSTPKPQQGRFYVAQSPDGKAQEDGLSKVQAGYSPNKGLRGRKVYPHHCALPDGYWDDPTADRTQQGRGQPAHFQEYRMPRREGQEQLTDQNRSILGWVKPGAQFGFELNVLNLSEVELGALLWLLHLPADHYFRLGGGKPLGFGSVRLEIEACDLRTGEALRERYTAWHVAATPADPREEAVTAFKSAVKKAYGASAPDFDHVTFIAAFLTACRGYSDTLPIHYPRATESGEPGPPSPYGESFKWFVANERQREPRALPDLTSDGGLPTLPERAGQQ